MKKCLYNEFKNSIQYCSYNIIIKTLYDNEKYHTTMFQKRQYNVLSKAFTITTMFILQYFQHNIVL